MAEIIDKIFKELDALEESASKLRGVAASSGKQTNLEVAILNQQLAAIREKNAAATEYIGKAEGILKKLKK
ncbi:MAG: hypothetical protein FWE17_03050 [Alphaproteobacteria bacterium]|nr:hypothetical protein [Alphaproteobacteria bacterium]MCL2758168.1 hypothetical protein [Alphaproteobacteria bacterium]